MQDYYKRAKKLITKYCIENNIQLQQIHGVISRFKEGNVKQALPRFKRLRKLGKGLTKERFVIQYGKTLGLEKWNQYCEKQRYTNSKEYKGMTDKEFTEYNKSRACTLDNFIKRYGKIIGQEKWDHYCERQRYTNSLEYFCEKYGEDGYNKWILVNKLKGSQLESYQFRYGKDEGLKRYIHSREHEKYNTFQQKISQDLFDLIDNKFQLSKKFNIYYDRLNKEFGKYCEQLNQYVYYDFVVPELKICIEFNGDHFHANPKLFSENDHPNPFNKNISSLDIWDRDKLKNDKIISEGFDLFIIWEYDYRNNKEFELNRIFSFIEQKIKEYEQK